MATRMQQRRGTAAQWTAANPILAAGEIGFETDTNKFKMGNGTSAWTALTYFANATELAAAIDAVVGIAPDTLDTLAELASAIDDNANFFTDITQSIADSIDQHNSDQTNVHGIVNTQLLATLTNISETETYADAAVTAHAAESTNVHGIEDFADLAKTADVATTVTDAISSHSSDTTLIHGIADTSVLATLTNISETETYADAAVTSHNAETLLVHGIADTSLLATQDFVQTAIGNSAVDQSLLAGVGIDWNAATDQYDIDSTVATKTYADEAVSSAVTTLTKSSVGLANVDNTADANKPVSTATQTELDLKAPIANPTFTGTVAGVTKSHVGLANVDNTADANKPVSTATQTALDLKANKAAPTFTGTVTTADLTVTGNLTVEGTTTTISTANFTTEDALIYLGEGNSANLVDLGFVASFNDGTYQHTGLVKDSSDNKWKLFKGVTDEPTTTVNFTQGSLDALKVGAFEATTVTPSSGVVFSDGTQTKEGVPSLTPIIAKTDSYTLSALTERDSLIEVAKSTATTLTIPTDATLNFPIGTSIDILQTSTGQVTIAGAGGVTVNATPGLKLRTTWSSATLLKRAANTWVVYGDLTA